MRAGNTQWEKPGQTSELRRETAQRTAAGQSSPRMLGSQSTKDPEPGKNPLKFLEELNAKTKFYNTRDIF